jgi:hypothetical protein
VVCRTKSRKVAKDIMSKDKTLWRDLRSDEFFLYIVLRKAQILLSSCQGDDDLMNTTVRCALVLVLFAAFAGATLPAADEPEIGGMYASRGMNPDGSEYRGLVHIAKRGKSFVVSWMFPVEANGKVVFEPASVGIGLVGTGTLAVSYYGARQAGVVLYHIEENGQRLNGQWTVAGNDGAIYVETLTKLPPDEQPVMPAPSDRERQSPRPERERPRREPAQVPGDAISL